MLLAGTFSKQFMARQVIFIIKIILVRLLL